MLYAILFLFGPVLFYAGYQNAGGRKGLAIDWKNAEAVQAGWWLQTLYVTGTAIALIVAWLNK